MDKSNGAYMDMAEFIMFHSGNEGIITQEQLESKLIQLGLMFRKNKGIPDIQKALTKAKDSKRGKYKTELELELFALYLQRDILKVRRT